VIWLKSKAGQDDEGIKLIATNKKAFHEYFVLEKLEVGIVLQGSELRPCREGQVNLKEAFVDADGGQMWLIGVNIGPNPFSNRFSHDPTRKRKLLAHKNQILKLAHKTETSGNTLVPLRMYFRQGKAKVEIGLVKGKKLYDKRDSIAKKDMQRQVERELSGRE
jgi:SsrA-binding protein